MTQSDQQDPKTFTDFLRRLFKGILDSIAAFLNKLGIRPNMVTAAGLIGNLIAAILIAYGKLTWGGLIAMLVGPLDALDGTMARMRNESGRYGAFVDSVTDRYSEIALYGGLLVYFNKTGTWQDALLVFFAAVGSIMVSYTRARAEALNYSAKIGLLTRAERYIVLIPGIIFGFPHISLWILALMTHVTALQRFWYVRKQAKETPPH
ncbi:MAG: CDP-alcohol phosphatidyltransferase family protein [Brevefilum sp.]|nr:CDP-alcohol phosphatidyltransferase family protein [Brevefilum sp.]MDT8381165.1 CDP-alcohol phosphatidyltransferase family protein [Brevefilum sp.]MDW7754972.1 CDP-alcohol phosphatidyltransferase family protein [Brevefilum sp.]